MGLRSRTLRPPPALLAAAVLLSPVAQAEAQAAEGRWHFRYGAPSPFQLSILFRRGSGGDETRLLLAAPPGRLELLATQGPEGNDSEETIVEPDGGERFSRRLHFSSRRRPAACAGVREMDGCLVFTGRFGERTAPLSGFVAGPDGDRLRAEVSALVTERLASKIASLAPLFARSVEFDRFGDDFLSLVWPTLAWKRPGQSEQPERGPGCAFDASFGYPCTERQREQEKRRLGAFPRRSRGKRVAYQRELPSPRHCDKISRRNGGGTMRIMRIGIRPAVLATLFAGVTAQAQPQSPPPPPAESQAPAVNPAPAASPAVEEVISLYNAKFSEDFIKRKIKGDGTIYNLSVADLLRLKEAGIPESLVDAMLATKRAQPAPAEGQAPGTAVPAPASAAAPALLPGQSRPPKEWEGLVRKSSGSVLGIGSRWENGSLHLENEEFKWITVEGTDRNALIPVASLKEQFLVCEKKPQGDCFEWGVKTKDGEYRFRDILWKTGPTPKARAIHDYMKVAYPTIAAPTYPVDERK